MSNCEYCDNPEKFGLRAAERQTLTIESIHDMSHHSKKYGEALEAKIHPELYPITARRGIMCKNV